MEKEELRTQVRAMVDDLFGEKEESVIRKKTEIALGNSAETISDLTATLEEKVTEIAELETKVSEGEDSIQTLEKELEAAREELETSKTSLKEKEDVIDDMNKAKAAEERMSELESAGVARAEKDSQFEKIKEMSDEEFASYKEELVYVRSAVEAELEQARAKEEATKTVADESTKTVDKTEEADEGIKVAKEEGAKEEGSEEEVTEDVKPANITPGQVAMAALNMEYKPTSDIMSKYAKLGEAMAAKWKDESKE